MLGITRAVTLCALVLAGLLAKPVVAVAQTDYEVVAAFGGRGDFGVHPAGELVQASDGRLYGTTVGGGAFGYGTAFRLELGGTLTTLHAFNSGDGAWPYGGVIQGTDGNFYGTTFGSGRGIGLERGTVFRLDQSGALTTLHAFDDADGGRPFGGLIEGSDGNLYGTTTRGGAFDYGTIFKIDPLGTLTTLHSFDYLVDGARPYGGLLQGSDGNIYGTTRDGGAFGIGGVGTVFKLDASGTLTTLHVFNPITAEGRSFASLIEGINGSLYGTTSMYIGGYGRGTIFELNTAGVLITRHRFVFESRGIAPLAGLIQGSDGSVYGTTFTGGVFNGGTVYKVDHAGTLTTLHAFNNIDGALPAGGVIQGADGSLYGTAYHGGAFDAGTVFKLDSSGTLTTLHAFHFAVDGYAPATGVIQGADGSLYGTTSRGGAHDGGTLFRLDPAGTLTTLHSFRAGPVSGLIQARDGNIYAMAADSVFRLDTQGAVTTVHSFGDGWGISGLTEGSDGSLYGTTTQGEALGPGTVFRLDVSGTLTTLHTFEGSDGANPTGRLIEGNDGNLYGTTFHGGAFGLGTVFKLDTSGMLTTLHAFNGSDGANPYAGVIQAADGQLYGTTSHGGPHGRDGIGGVVFRLSVVDSR